MHCGSMMNVVCIAGSFRSGTGISLIRSPKKATAGEMSSAKPSTMVRDEPRNAAELVADSRVAVMTCCTR